MIKLPNIRKLFTPDPGKIFWDMDLDRADLQVVVWEADDAELKQALREGVDLHCLNAKTLFNLSCPLGEIKAKFPLKRQLAKSWVHGTNYGGGPRTMAIACGITVKEAERMQYRWFEAHPGIKRWHERTTEDLAKTHSVRNRFGYRRFYFDRLEGILPEALAWIPQSTVACVINEVWIRFNKHLPDVDVLIQVHDSLAGQLEFVNATETLMEMRELAKVTIPYPDPLVIPVGINTSQISWGDCK